MKLILLIFTFVILCVIIYKLFLQSPSLLVIFGNYENNILSKINKEYNNYVNNVKRLNILYKYTKSKKEEYEAKNILERWLLSSYNFDSSTTVHASMQAVLTPDSNQTKQMEYKISKKLSKSPLEAKKIVSKVISIQPRNKKINTKSLKIRKHDNQYYIKIGNFKKYLSNERVNILRKLASDDQIILATLRYASILAGNQHWNIPASVYKILVENHNAEIEGFASPFNSQIIRFNNTKRYNFCSLFHDTDAVFGSVGSFFDYDFTNKITVVNPPYVLDIMESCVKKIQETLLNAPKNKTTKFFITVPNWLDTNYYNVLLNSEFLEAKLLHEKTKYYYEDSNQSDKKIIAKFDSTMFVLNNNPPNKLNNEKYQDIINAFSV